ncbi:MAG: PDC sensor domain-containing protein [Treponema sp.]
MRDSTRSFTERVQFVTQEFASDPRVDTVGICDLQGNRYDIAGNTTAAGNYEWFRSAATGNNFVSEPQVSRSSNKMQMIFAVPIYGEGHTPYRRIERLCSCTAAQ